MQTHHSPLDPDLWLHNIFATKQVQQGGIIRRKARDVERFCGYQRFMTEINRRGFQVAENGGQFIIFCNAEPIRLLT